MKKKLDKELVEGIGQAIGMAQKEVERAIKEEKVTEEQLAFLAENIHVLKVMKAFGDHHLGYKRATTAATSKKYVKRKTREQQVEIEGLQATGREQRAEIEGLQSKLENLTRKVAELKTQLLRLENSELLKFGRQVKEAMKLDRKQRTVALKEHKLVHSEDHTYIRDRYRDGETEALKRLDEAYASHKEYKWMTDKRLQRAEQLVVERLGQQAWDNYVLSVK